MSEYIPLAHPDISETAISAAVEVLRSGWPGPGLEVALFEQEFAAAVGAKHAIGTGSATDALQLAVTMLDLSLGDEVITTPNTFVSSNHVLLHAGATPVFADIERDTGNIDVASIEARITDATRAIMVVHYSGYPCDLDAIEDLAKRYGLAVVEDCAHAAGAVYRDRPIGASTSTGSYCAFSFHSTKNLSAVDGGALCVDDDASAARARRLRWMGIDRCTYDRQTDEGYHWEYDITEVGFRSTMSDLNAALGRAGLAGLTAANARRTLVAARYLDGLASIDGIEPMRHAADRVSSHCLFPVLVDDRDRTLDHLRANGIGAGVHYKSNDRYPVYEPAHLPNAHWFADHVLSLPMYAGLADADVDRILETLATR